MWFDDVEQQKDRTYRNGTIGDIEGREGPCSAIDLDEICDGAAKDAVD
jgi:hypothetical protein